MTVSFQYIIHINADFLIFFIKKIKILNQYFHSNGLMMLKIQLLK